MNPPTPSPEHPVPDPSLPEEAGIRELYAGRSGEQPGPELDARVRRMAARALEEDGSGATGVPHERVTTTGRRERGRVDARPRGAHARRRSRSSQPWWLAAGSVAVVVVAVGLARHLQTSPPPRAASTGTVPAGVATASAGKASGNEVSAAAPATEAAPAPAKPAAERVEPSIVGRSPPAPAPVPREPRRVSRFSAAVAAPPAPPAPAPPARQAPAVTNGASARAGAPAASPPVMEMSVNVDAAPLSLAPAAKAMPARAPGAALSTSGPVASKALQRIRDLFAAGEDARARRLLQAFRQAHPQRELPPDLRAKLRGD